MRKNEATSISLTFRLCPSLSQSVNNIYGCVGQTEFPDKNASNSLLIAIVMGVWFLYAFPYWCVSINSALKAHCCQICSHQHQSMAAMMAVQHPYAIDLIMCTNRLFNVASNKCTTKCQCYIIHHLSDKMFTQSHSNIWRSLHTLRLSSTKRKFTFE